LLPPLSFQDSKILLFSFTCYLIFCPPPMNKVRFSPSARGFSQVPRRRNRPLPGCCGPGGFGVVPSFSLSTLRCSLLAGLPPNSLNGKESSQGSLHPGVQLLCTSFSRKYSFFPFSTARAARSSILDRFFSPFSVEDNAP